MEFAYTTRVRTLSKGFNNRKYQAKQNHRMTTFEHTEAYKGLRMYATLPSQAERLFSQFEPITSRLQRRTLLLHQGLPSLTIIITMTTTTTTLPIACHNLEQQMMLDIYKLKKQVVVQYSSKIAIDPQYDIYKATVNNNNKQDGHVLATSPLA